MLGYYFVKKKQPVDFFGRLFFDKIDLFTLFFEQNFHNSDCSFGNGSAWAKDT
jgi:hypothetical protein